MFKHILVPLDGSDLSESALPAARFLAGKLGSAITLIHVVERDAPTTIHGERHLRTPEEATAYLQEVTRRICPPGGVVACHVHADATRNVAQSILDHEGELIPDLIIMCTHGRGRLQRILLGSIAQQVVGNGRTPVLLIRPDNNRRGDTFDLETLLAPLDGGPAHEQGLEYAQRLAQATGARLQLLSVVPTMGTLTGHDAAMGRFMPGTLQAILEYARKDLNDYLASQVSRIRQAGVQAEAELRYGDIAHNIVDVADSRNVSMIVLGTHGKAGTEAFWSKSVAANVQAHTRRPLLLVPIR